MSEHRVTIRWKLDGGDFLKGKYSREHLWTFDGGAVVTASASPSVVPAPWSNPTRIDPEEAYVAAISSCHMLWFLHVAREQGFQVEGYDDEAVGVMTKSDLGSLWVSAVKLYPKVSYGTTIIPSPAEEDRLHHEA